MRRSASHNGSAVHSREAVVVESNKGGTFYRRRDAASRLSRARTDRDEARPPDREWLVPALASRLRYFPPARTHDRRALAGSWAEPGAEDETTAPSSLSLLPLLFSSLSPSRSRSSLSSLAASFVLFLSLFLSASLSRPRAINRHPYAAIRWPAAAPLRESYELHHASGAPGIGDDGNGNGNSIGSDGLVRH